MRGTGHVCATPFAVPGTPQSIMSTSNLKRPRQPFDTHTPMPSALQPYVLFSMHDDLLKVRCTLRLASVHGGDSCRLMFICDGCQKTSF